MTRAEYEASICERLPDAAHLQFRKVSLPERRPKVADRDANVDRWVEANPGDTPVRGWVTLSQFMLTAHSVVRERCGRLFDITPLETQDPRIRENMLFIPHLGAEESFFSMKKLNLVITCWRPAEL